MALAADIRKNLTDTTPVFAAVGLTDLAVEKVRDARLKVASARVDIYTAPLQGAPDHSKDLPALALNRSLELAGMARQQYESYASRGEKLVKRVRTQKATTDLIAQAEATFALGKGAVTTVRKSATDIQRSAKATITTGRKEAVVAADAIADSVVDEAADASATVTKAAKRTRTAAKRTSTTTRKSAATSKSATKRATTGARKTAAAGRKASTTAAAKVGD
jgi:heparin binding hemagglutinin HbhA